MLVLPLPHKFSVKLQDYGCLPKHNLIIGRKGLRRGKREKRGEEEDGRGELKGWELLAPAPSACPPPALSPPTFSCLVFQALLGCSKWSHYSGVLVLLDSWAPGTPKSFCPTLMLAPCMLASGLWSKIPGGKQPSLELTLAGFCSTSLFGTHRGFGRKCRLLGVIFHLKECAEAAFWQWKQEWRH